MIKIYNAKVTDFTQADYTKTYSLLERALKEKIDLKKNNDDKMRSLAGLVLLYRGAYELYGKTRFDITFNKYGKPLCDFCNFSISHSGDRVICAFSDMPVGADIQMIYDIKPRGKYKFFNEKENFYVNQNSALLSERYIEIFTRKEAAVKMLGLSIAHASEIDTFSNKYCFETRKTDGYVFSICEKNV